VPTLQTALRYPNLSKYMEQKIEDKTSPNNEEVNEPETVEEPEVGLPADPVEVEPKDDAEEEAEVLKQKNQELYEQLKKAKGFIRDKTGKWVKKEAPVPPKEVEGTGDISKTELYSLVKANVPDEDVDEVVIYARSHKISVTEALKKDEVKAILKVKNEHRKTAEAANTGSSRSGKLKVSDDTLEANASKGNLPTDDAGIERLANLKAGKKG